MPDDSTATESDDATIVVSALSKFVEAHFYIVSISITFLKLSAELRVRLPVKSRRKFA